MKIKTTLTTQPITAEIAHKLAPTNQDRDNAGDGGLLLMPGGAKLYRTRNNRYWISGYVGDGSDIAKALKSVNAYPVA